MHPITQQAIIKGIDIVGRKWLQNSHNPETPNDITRDTMEKLDRFQREVGEIKESAKHIEQIKEQEVKNNSEDKSSANENKSNTNSDKENYSNYAPDMDVATGCITCSRAHILGIRGSLREALRFAREDGVEHPEVIKRVDNAAEELVTMERFDLTPEQIKNSPPEEKEIIEETLPKIRELRQNLINNIDNVEDLEEAAALAGEIYNHIRYKTKERRVS